MAELCSIAKAVQRPQANAAVFLVRKLRNLRRLKPQRARIFLSLADVPLVALCAPPVQALSQGSYLLAEGGTLARRA